MEKENYELRIKNYELRIKELQVKNDKLEETLIERGEEIINLEGMIGNIRLETTAVLSELRKKIADVKFYFEIWQIKAETKDIIETQKARIEFIDSLKKLIYLEV